MCCLGFFCNFAVMKKDFLSFFLLMALLMSCGKSYEEQRRITREQRAEQRRQDSLALKVAVLPTADCLPIFVAAERGWFDSLKIDVRLRPFKAQMDVDTALMGRSVEGAITDLVRGERMRNRGTALNYVAATNLAWQLVANRTARVKETRQLGDKMVAMTRYSATDLLTDRALKGVKTTATVYRVQINDIALRLQMLKNNEMDALWLPEPQATAARQLKHTVIWKSDSTDLRLGVLAFREKAMKDQRIRKQIDSFLKAYNAACDSLNGRGVGHYADILEKYCGVNQTTIQAMPKLKFSRAAAPREKDV